MKHIQIAARKWPEYFDKLRSIIDTTSRMPHPISLADSPKRLSPGLGTAVIKQPTPTEGNLHKIQIK